MLLAPQLLLWLEHLAANTMQKYVACIILSHTEVVMVMRKRPIWLACATIHGHVTFMPYLATAGVCVNFFPPVIREGDTDDPGRGYPLKLR